MSWQNYYIPPNISQWQGRADTPNHSAFFQIVSPYNLLNHSLNTKLILTTSKKTFALVGFCCDEGIRRNFGRLGAVDGPAALRSTLSKFPVHNVNFDLYDVGDVVCMDGNLEAAQDALTGIVALLISADITPIVIGGGHEVAWGHYRGVVKSFLQKKLGIINFDAHLDMRPLLSDGQGSSGTPFLQIAQDCENHQRHFDYNCIGVQKTGNTRQLFETAQKYNVNTIFAEEFYLPYSCTQNDLIERVIETNDILYTTICLDVFAAAYAPGVSAVQPLGLLPWQVIPLIRRIARSQKSVTYDIAELSPAYDSDQRTAKLAASLVYEIIHA